MDRLEALARLRTRLDEIQHELGRAENDLRDSSLNRVLWNEAPTPALFHHCWVQTDAWQGFTQIQRCACGAMRTNRTMRPRWHGINERRGVLARAISWLPLTALSVLRGGVINLWVLFAIMMTLWYIGALATVGAIRYSGNVIPGVLTLLLGTLMLWPIEKTLRSEE